MSTHFSYCRTDKVKTMDRIYRMLWAFTGLVFLTFLHGYGQEVPTGSYWKEQSLEQIIEPWRKHVFDDKDGGYQTYMKRKWQSYQFSKQYPGMISRQLYSFSTAYLLSGKPQYLLNAHQTFSYLIENGWDEKYGGWFFKLDDQGRLEKEYKDLQMQSNALSGLSMYYLVTRNSKAKEYIDKTYGIINEEGWDQDNKGYYQRLKRNLTLAESKKVISAQINPLSGFLTYLFPITRDSQYLERMDEVTNICLKRMRHPQNNMIVQEFTENWSLSGGTNDNVNIGQNLKVTLMALRCFHYTGDTSFKEDAVNLAKSVKKKGFDQSSGAWRHKWSIDNNGNNANKTAWWVQAYGNLTQLYLYRVTKNEDYLQSYQKGVKFWNKHFIDQDYGGTFKQVSLNGKVTDSDKASKNKTAYHAMVHGLFNNLYTNLFIKDEQVKLHYSLSYTQEDANFYPAFFADNNITIKKVSVNDKQWKDFEPDQQKIRLPGAKSAKLEVTFEYN